MITDLLRRRLVWLGLVALCLPASTGSAATLELSIRHVFAGEPLQLGSLRYDTGAREHFSVTRLSYLLSGFAFQRDDGSWLELTNSVLWLDVEKGRTAGRVELPSAAYRGVRFHVGLETNHNHADVAAFGSGHPLNPRGDSR